MQKPEYFTCMKCHKQIAKMNEILHNLTCKTVPKQNKVKKVEEKVNWLEDLRKHEFKDYPKIPQKYKKEIFDQNKENENLIKCPKCSKTIFIDEVEDHTKNCDYENCLYCSHFFPKQVIDQHFQYCEKNENKEYAMENDGSFDSDSVNDGFRDSEIRNSDHQLVTNEFMNQNSGGFGNFFGFPFQQNMDSNQFSQNMNQFSQNMNQYSQNMGGSNQFSQNMGSNQNQNRVQFQSNINTNQNRNQFQSNINTNQNRGNFQTQISTNNGGYSRQQNIHRNPDGSTTIEIIETTPQGTNRTSTRVQNYQNQNQSIQNQNNFSFPNFFNHFQNHGDFMRSNRVNFLNHDFYEQILEQLQNNQTGMNRNSIDRIKKIKFEKKNNIEGEEEQCPICITEYEDKEVLRELSCKHLFHPECIDTWLVQNSSCPICKKDISRQSN